MTVQGEPAPELNRRDFLASTAAVGGAMVLGFHLPPTSAQAGKNRVSLKVIDGQGGSATESFTIVVAN